MVVLATAVASGPEAEKSWNFECRKSLEPVGQDETRLPAGQVYRWPEIQAATVTVDQASREPEVSREPDLLEKTQASRVCDLPKETQASRSLICQKGPRLQGSLISERDPGFKAA